MDFFKSYVEFKNIQFKPFILKDNIGSDEQQAETPSSKSVQKTKQIIQHVLVPTGQKVLLPQNISSIAAQKVIVAQQSTPGVAAGTATTSNSLQPAQVTTHHYLNNTNVQQEIVMNGQRILLAPGQTIVTQRAITQSGQSAGGCGGGAAAAQVTQVSTSPSIPSNSSSIPDTKKIKDINEGNNADDNPFSQIKVPAGKSSSQPPKVITIVTQQGEKSAQTTTTEVGGNSQQQIVGQNPSVLAQQLAQGKLLVATVNGQQVIIKPLGNGQAQIVAHIKMQSDGNSHIVTTGNMESQNQQKSTKSPTTQISHVRKY